MSLFKTGRTQSFQYRFFFLPEESIFDITMPESTAPDQTDALAPYLALCATVVAVAAAAGGHGTLHSGHTLPAFLFALTALSAVAGLFFIAFGNNGLLGKAVLLTAVLLLSVLVVAIPQHVPYLILLVPLAPAAVLFLGGGATGGILLLCLLALGLMHGVLVSWNHVALPVLILGVIVLGTAAVVLTMAILLQRLWSGMPPGPWFPALRDPDTNLMQRRDYLARAVIAPGTGILVVLRDLATIEADHGLEGASKVRADIAQRICAISAPHWVTYQHSQLSFILVPPPQPQPQPAQQSDSPLATQQMAQQLRDALHDATASGEGSGIIEIAVLPPGEPLPPNEVARRLETALQLRAHQEFAPVAQYDSILDLRRKERRRLAVHLRHAISGHHLTLSYQPIVDALDRQPIALQVQPRWHHNTLGTVEPERFLAVAEEEGMIATITEWQLAAAWQELRIHPGNEHIAVPIARRHLSDPKFLHHFTEIVETSGIEARRIVLEIAEDALNDRAVVRRGVVAALVSTGVTITINHFGTGATNLEQLQQIPARNVKIDQSFARDLFDTAGELNTRVAPVVEAMVFMARSLGMSVICDGVTREDTAQWLHGVGCDAFQGPLCGRPFTIGQG